MAFDHPAFAPYACLLDAFGRSADLPDIGTLNRLARHARLALPDGTSLRFEAAGAQRKSALDYERRIASGVVEVRGRNAHDVANALVWLAFPRLKSALNAIHVRDGHAPTANGRSRARDTATLIDEAGLLFVCADQELVGMLRAWRWRELFWARRDAVANRIRAIVVGHGLLDKLRAPYRALTAQALVIDVAASDTEATRMERIDAAAARTVGDPRFGPRCITPLPIAALPGWDSEALGERLFDDRAVFRIKR